MEILTWVQFRHRLGLGKESYHCHGIDLLENSCLAQVYLAFKIEGL